MTLTKLNSKGIKDGEILNADINASAAIDGSKLNPVGLSNVGINSATTNYELQVNDSSGTVSVIQLTNTTTGTGAGDGFLVYNNGVNALLSNEEIGDLRLQTSGQQRVTIDSDGNVGIGDTDPTVLLSLKSTAPTIRLTDSDASGTPECQILGGGGDLTLSADRDNEKSDTKILFQTDGSTKLTIDSSGRILTGGATSFNSSTNADDLQIGASGQSNQTGISLGSAQASSLRFMDVANDSAGYILYNHGNDELTIGSTTSIAFSCGGNVANIDSTGIKLPSGKGINFSAYATSASGSGSPDPSSNLLDDYEEGTFTPTLGWSLTPTTATGRYTKIGRLVTYSLSLTWPTNTNGNYALLGSLPFSGIGGAGAFIRYTNYSGGSDLAFHQNTGNTLTLYTDSGSTITNQTLSGKRIDLAGFFYES